MEEAGPQDELQAPSMLVGDMHQRETTPGQQPPAPALPDDRWGQAI